MEVLQLVDVPLWLLLVVVVGLLVYLYLTWPQRQLRALGYQCPPGNVFLGHMKELRYGHKDVMQEWIRKYGRVFGLRSGLTPMIVVADLDILKEILIKDFNNFSDRKNVGVIQSPWDQGVFFLGGEDWRRVRNIITPTFSSGKLKSMAAPINHCARTLATNFQRCAEEGRTVNVKEVFGGFTLQAIARTAFGLDVDCQQDKDEPFFLHVRALFEEFLKTNSLQRYLVIASLLCPGFGRMLHFLFNFGVFNKRSSDFFAAIIPQMLMERKQRQEAGVSKSIDFLQLLLNAEASEEEAGKTEQRTDTERTKEEAGKTEKRTDTERTKEEAGKTEKRTDTERTKEELGEEEAAAKNEGATYSLKKRLHPVEVVAQAFLFFIAGYETTATTLQYAAFCLASRPDLQQRLRLEIHHVLGDREPSCEDAWRLPLLHQVLCETLRLYPPITRVMRKAAQDRHIRGFRFPRDMGIMVPIFAIHHDPHYNPDPETFDPERFSPERQASRHPLAWLPFGQGPRLCLGMRLALVEAKMALVHVLRKCELTTCSETPEKLEFLDLGVLTPTKPIVIGARLLTTEQ